jgi:hypothetical protein
MPGCGLLLLILLKASSQKAMNFPGRYRSRWLADGYLRRKRMCCSPSWTVADRSETWAGCGVKPRWMVEALKKGKKIESFLIKKK